MSKTLPDRHSSAPGRIYKGETNGEFETYMYGSGDRNSGSQHNGVHDDKPDDIRQSRAHYI